MRSISRFDTAVQCEETISFTESDYDEVMTASSSLYIDPRDGKVKQIPEPPSKGRLFGVEL